MISCPELLLIARDHYQNETKTTLAATASTATSNVSSSCAYSTMDHPGRLLDCIMLIFSITWHHQDLYVLLSIENLNMPIM